MQHLFVSPESFVSRLRDTRQRLDFVLHGSRTVDRTWHFSGRRIPEHLLYVITGGSGWGTIENEPVAFLPGTILWMAPGAVHDFGLHAGKPPLRLYHFRFTLRDNTRDVSLKRPFLRARDIEETRDAAMLHNELAIPGVLGETRRRALLLLVLSGIIRRNAITTPAGNILPPSLMGRIAAYAQTRCADHPSPADLARLCELSPDYFSRRFRATTGMAPREWLVRRRLQIAAEMVDESARTITEIARATGYEDIFLFSRQFKRHFGLSPRAWRRRHS